MRSFRSLHKNSKSSISKIEERKEDNVTREEYLLTHVVPSRTQLRLGIPSPLEFYTWFEPTPVQFLTETWTALRLDGKYKIKTQTKKRKS